MFEINTLIELFDICQIENVVSAMRLLPERIVFVGYKEIMTNKRKDDIENFFKIRGIKIQLEYEVVGRYDFDMIVDKLCSLVDKYPDSCFDLTGGKELVLAAMGLVAAEKGIPMVQFDIKKGTLIPVRNSDLLADNMNSRLAIKETVALNGGLLIPDAMPWDLNDEFKADVFALWKICSENCRYWNRQSNLFGSFGEFCKDGITVDADLARLRNKGTDTYINHDIITGLQDAGLIQNFILKKNRVTFCYKNEQIRRALIKAGNVLELYVYITAHEINKSNPGYYGDIEMGAVVDWDGRIHECYDPEVDTINEIDIFLMRGMVPVFISCKNGNVHKEALYELDTVARKIGGKYAKKILISTYLGGDSDNSKYILTRGKDMGIHIMDDIHNKTKEDFLKEFKEITK